MYKALKYALDQLFIFVLILNVSLFLIGMKVDLDKDIMMAIEGVDFAVLGGYYAFFGHGLLKAKKKFEYCKKHWIMAIFLALPAFPMARILRFAHLERLFEIGADTLWHVFDELELL